MSDDPSLPLTGMPCDCRPSPVALPRLRSAVRVPGQPHPPGHYGPEGEQPIDVMKNWMTPAEYQGFLRGNVIKYIARYDKKGRPTSDLRKAKQYLEWLIEEWEAQ